MELLIFQSVFPYRKEYILFILWVTRESPSKMKCGNQHVLSLLLTAITVQYLIGPKLCGIDCSGQDTGQATIAKLLNLTFKFKFNI